VEVSVEYAPIALPDAYDHSSPTPLTVSAPGVLANDLDGDGDPLAAAVVQPPAVGSLTLALDGGFTYTPTFGSDGIFTFTYSASDGILADTAVVTLTVDTVNDPPVADAGEDQSVVQGAIVALDGSGSSDPEGHALSYGWVQSGGTPLLALSDAHLVAPTFTATHAGAFTFTLAVTDTFGLSDGDSVVVTVSQPNYYVYLPLVVRGP
jgi:hypothetical protein